jgi:hypothetical protein
VVTVVGMGRRRWPQRARCWVGAVFMAISLSALAGCSAGRASLGTSASPCYVALPTAARAVGFHGRLLGVRLLGVSSVTSRHLGAVIERAGVSTGRVCLVAFSGTFRARSVSRPAGRPFGHLAVVVLRYPSGSLVATVLFRRLPTHFGHPHLG